MLKLFNLSLIWKFNMTRNWRELGREWNINACIACTAWINCVYWGIQVTACFHTNAAMQVNRWQKFFSWKSCLCRAAYCITGKFVNLILDLINLNFQREAHAITMNGCSSPTMGKAGTPKRMLSHEWNASRIEEAILPLHRKLNK